MPEEKTPYNKEQYDFLMKCSEKKDMSEWNQWILQNPEVVNLEKAKLNNANLSGAKLNRANLSGAKLSNANLSGAELNNADLSGATPFDADLSGAKLNNANLSGAELNHTNLSGAKLNSADLSGAILNNANLSRAELWYADFSGAKLNNANLSEAKLLGADLSGTGLWEANLSGAKLDNANLSGTILNHANLSWARFWDADLSGAILWDADFSGAILNHANLSGAELRQANIEGAIFTVAKVDGETLIWNCEIDKKTDFTGVGLDGVRIDPESKQLLQYNARRMRWECFYKYRDWYKDDSKEEKNIIEKLPNLFWKPFWLISKYGHSTGRIIAAFFVLSLLFAGIYSTSPETISGLTIEYDGMNLFQCFGLTLFRPIYFSIVTMTTLGFGDMHASPSSFWGHVLLTLQVLMGYVLLGALVTRFAVMFQAGGPTLRFKEIRKIREKQREKKN